jgi:hypothetical protein
MKSTLGDSPSRTEVLKFLFESSTYGNLGLFIGAGFSKAVFASEEEEVALSWGDLLVAASKMMGVELEKKSKRDGKSYPELASLLCIAHSEKNGCSVTHSRLVLKHALSATIAWYPSEPERSEYSGYLEELAPSWIVTTNYDQVIECLLPGKSMSLGPKDSFSSPKGIIPIFHLHGVRTRPNGLIITQEDYVRLFRPSQYRQIRLALTLKESTTCLLGYGLGDVNVLTALDWSKNVFAESEGNYPHEVIQVLWHKTPKTEPYRLGNKIIVVETDEIAAFCKEYAAAAVEMRKERKQLRTRLKKVTNIFKDLDPEDVSRFIDNEAWRRSILKVLGKHSIEVVAEFEAFLQAALKESRRRSGKTGAFHEYAKNLNIILDLLTAFDCEDFPPALLAATVRNFDRLANYIGNRPGDSFAAKRVLDERKGELSEAMVTELTIIARQHLHVTLRGLLKDLQ